MRRSTAVCCLSAAIQAAACAIWLLYLYWPSHPTHPPAFQQPSVPAALAPQPAAEGQPWTAANGTVWLPAHVDRVADGDTLEVRMADGKAKVRLYGIDAPEKDQPFGKESKANLTSLLPDGRVWLLQHDRDPYGLIVCEAIDARGASLSQAQVSGGYAWWYREHAPEARPLQAAQADAVAARRGLWAQADPVPPWDWRHPRQDDKAKRATGSDSGGPNTPKR